MFQNAFRGLAYWSFWNRSKHDVQNLFPLGRRIGSLQNLGFSLTRRWRWWWRRRTLTVDDARDDGRGGGSEVEEGQDVVDDGRLLDAEGEQGRHHGDEAEGEEVGVLGQGGHVQRHRVVEEVRDLVAKQVVDVRGDTARHTGRACRTRRQLPSPRGMRQRKRKSRGGIRTHDRHLLGTHEKQCEYFTGKL